MLIAIDYDGTFTAAPALFWTFIEQCNSFGIQVICVTGRTPRQKIVNAYLTIPIIYAGSEHKRKAAERAGYKVDIWIDDTPEMIGESKILNWDDADLPAPHHDDICVEQFACEMKAKLARKRAEGRSGWEDPEVVSIDDLAMMLVEHVEKGDPLDVANFCMMLSLRASAPQALQQAMSYYIARATTPHEEALLKGVVTNNNLQGSDIQMSCPAGTTIPVGTVMIACPHPDVSHDCCVICGKSIVPGADDWASRLHATAQVVTQEDKCQCDSCKRGVTAAKKSDADLGKCSMCNHPHMCPVCDS